MGKTAPAHLTAPLHDYVAELLAEDEKRRGEYIRPVHLFRTAVEEIKRWSETWDLAPTGVRNGLLREAGVQVVIASPADDPKGQARIVSIKAQHPTFALALAIAVRNVALALPGPNPAQPRNAMDLVEVSADLRAILRLVPRGESHDFSNLFLVRPFLSITMRQAAAALGVTDATTYGMARLGVIDVARVDSAILTTQIEVDRLREFSPQQLRALLRRVVPEEPDAGAVTAQEAANLLGISLATARTWISAGKIATHSGRRTLIPIAEIDRLGLDRLVDAA